MYVLRLPQEDSMVASQCGELMEEDEESYFINAASQLGLPLGIWALTGKIKAVPKDEASLFESEQDLMKRWTELNMRVCEDDHPAQEMPGMEFNGE